VAAEVFVVAEQSEGRVKRPSLEAMTAGRRLAGDLGTTAAAVVAGEGAEGAAEALGRHGAERVVVVDADPADVATWAVRVAAQLAPASPAAVVLAHSARGKDLAPRLAAVLDAPMASDVVALSADDGTIVARRPVFAGKAIAQVAGAGTTLVVTVRPNAFRAEESAAAGTVETGKGEGEPKGLGAVLKEVVTAASKKIDLAEAAVIVSGGRGMKGPENWHLIEELAGALGAATGASRAVVDAGWRPHAEQVGQTGKTVSPTLYIACGISGAIQHLAGMRTSKYIVAVNKDPEAPIFKVADYGIVGDVFDVLPALTNAVKEARTAV